MSDKISTQFVNNVLQAAVFLDTAFDIFHAQYNITRVQYLALLYILEEGEEGMALSKLGEKMSVSRANITKLVDRMEKAGLIVRVPDQKDRRSIKVKALERGAEVYHQLMPRRMQLAESILENLTREELTQANDLLTKINADLQKQMKQLSESEAI